MLELRQTSEFMAWVKGIRDRSAVQRIAVRLTRMQLGNFGNVKSVGEGVSEARIFHGPGYRLYFVRRGDTLICSAEATNPPRPAISSGRRPWPRTASHDRQDPSS